MSGDLQGKPAIIMHGRADQVVAPNHGGRAYYARNRQVDARDDVALEIENGHHLEMFAYLLAPNLGFYATPPNMQHRYAYIHPYFEQAPNQMFAHLSSGRGAGLRVRWFARRRCRKAVKSRLQMTCLVKCWLCRGEDVVRWQDNTLVIPH
ncbi:3-hydroxybutyrate oligomer hydrolase family protein [Vibrio sp. M60_M31a]